MHPYQFGIGSADVITAGNPNDTMTDKEAYLVKITASTGTEVAVDLLDDAADIAIGVIEAGAAATYDVEVRLLKDGNNIRVRNGATAITRGDRIFCQAGGTVIPDAGAVSDVYFCIGVAEEDCAANELVLVRVHRETVSV